MTPVLTTPRMALRRITADDAALLVELDSDPEVMRYLTGGRPTPLADAQREVEQRFLPQYDRHPGLGRWLAHERTTGDFLGWFALDPPREVPPTSAELGYRLRRAAWGQGYATEGAAALLEHAFGELGLRRVWATTMTVNTASRRVMEKAGLRFVRTFVGEYEVIEGSEEGDVEYALTLEEWRG